MQRHNGKSTAIPSPFGFWAGFWLGLDAITTAFHRPSRFEPARYGSRGSVADDWRAVAGDLRKAGGRMKEGRE